MSNHTSSNPPDVDRIIHFLPGPKPKFSPFSPTNWYWNRNAFVRRSLIRAKELSTGFELTSDLPGVLSELGPRYDNNHANLFDIKILPITDEV